MHKIVKCVLAAATVTATFTAVAAREDGDEPTGKDMTIGAAAAAVVGLGLAWLIAATESDK
ncbi:hypothetical protein pEaSNUABM54_00118 [Erwinia phage pEa_SNUABM_54]|nr:hypothetical protein pEaSNUABM54_00118 [Erwinia phage pEa_SNUABM_54]